MINLTKYGYSQDSIDALLSKMPFSNGINVSAINPFFAQFGIRDSIAIDEILRSYAHEENTFNDLIATVNKIGVYKVSLVDLLNCNTTDIGHGMEIICFPGLGATSQVFSGVEYRNKYLTSVNYNQIDFSAGIDSVIDETITKYSITSNHTLLSTSFGGLLANRIAAVLKSKNVIMIGGLANPIELGYMRHLALRLKILHIFSLSQIPRKITTTAFGIKTQECENIFFEMLSNYVPTKILEMLKFIVKCRNIQCHASLRIHGKSDLLIPRPERVNEWVDGGHIITMSENETNHIILNEV